MATTHGQQSHLVIKRLLDNPKEFSFFQAIWLLTQFHGLPPEKILRFKVAPTLAFNASDIVDLKEISQDNKIYYEMTVSFTGLIGSMGTLPMHYRETLIKAVRARESHLSQFYDWLSQRSFELLYEAWAKGTLYADDSMTDLINSLMGITQQKSKALFENRYYVGHMSRSVRSAHHLQQLLNDAFPVTIQVREFEGQWYSLSTEEQRRMKTLSFNAVIGTRVYQLQTGIRIQIGPLSSEDINDYLPGGEQFNYLKKLLFIYLSDQYDISYQYFMPLKELRHCNLGNKNNARLGYNSWLPTHKLEGTNKELMLKNITYQSVIDI